MLFTKLIASLVLLAQAGVLSSPVPVKSKTTSSVKKTSNTLSVKPVVPQVANSAPAPKLLRTNTVSAAKATTAEPKPLRRTKSFGDKPSGKPLDPCGGSGARIRRRGGCDPQPESLDGKQIPKGKTVTAKIETSQGTTGVPAMGTKDAPVHSKNVLDAAAKSKSNTEPMPINSPAQAAKQRAATVASTSTQPGTHRDEEPPATMRQDDTKKSTVLNAPVSESTQKQAPTIKEAKKVATGPGGSGKMQMGLNDEKEGLVVGDDLRNLATGGQSGQRGDNTKYNLRDRPS
ncbi:hypothetical protein PpBr36_02664 [Pyricularia pennisetigena]|uniref:hypothetical protein n=1 Tax=Pyricularia pennisetigena TaxID=1578925 RepID=UPI00115415AE|nr:hypothetical protein PpBr36_02664 [Pyricularia pennisetigena]TLS30843.1 hypothetical protein PpBr36_02664 [Pyricularia pennisetigena]